MKIKIEKSKLTDAPYSKEQAEAFLFEDEETVTQLTLGLKNARPSAYLISGYRGTGKTSLVNRVFEKVESEFLCVQLNVAKYESYPLLVKRLIRELYLKYAANDKSKELVNKDLTISLKLLYDRTFNDIVSSRLLHSKNEKKTVVERQYDLKKLWPLIPMLLSAGSIVFKYSTLILNCLIFISSFLWGILVTWKKTFSETAEAGDTDDHTIKSLYDDNIAEHHLFDALQKMQNKSIHVLIAFDEVDKLQSDDEVTKLIHDLKPLLLSGYVNSFVVAGQSLFYAYEHSSYQDDQVISTLFSKMIHVPFLKNAALKKFCVNLLVEENSKSEPLVSYFFDKIILGSGRIPRKLVNLVTSKIIWDGNQAIIDIADADYDALQIASALLNVLTVLTDSDLQPLCENDVQRDFFTAQVHMWVVKMKGYTVQYFKSSDIVDTKAYETYPTFYKSQLVPVLDLLIDKLTEHGFLKQKLFDVQDTQISEFRWLDPVIDATIITPTSVGDGDDRFPGIEVPNVDQSSAINIPVLEMNVKDMPDDLKNRLFITQFADLEGYLRELYVEIEPIASANNGVMGMKELIRRLANLNVLKKTWYKSSKIDSLIRVRNRVAHGEQLSEVDLNEIQSSTFTLSRLRSEINEEFVNFVTRSFLIKYDLMEAKFAGFDFIAEAKDHIIAFEVKSVIHGAADTRNISEIIDRFSNFQLMSRKSTFYALFYFLPNRRKSYDEFYPMFNLRVAEAGYSFKDRLKLFYISETEQLGVKGTIERSLSELIIAIQSKHKNEQ